MLLSIASTIIYFSIKIHDMQMNVCLQYELHLVGITFILLTAPIETLVTGTFQKKKVDFQLSVLW